MKTYFLLMILALPVLALPAPAAEPVEISVQSGQRKALFDLLRPEVAQ